MNIKKKKTQVNPRMFLRFSLGVAGIYGIPIAAAVLLSAILAFLFALFGATVAVGLVVLGVVAGVVVSPFIWFGADQLNTIIGKNATPEKSKPKEQRQPESIHNLDVEDGAEVFEFSQETDQQERKMWYEY